jgi:predicted ABC-type ATPase
MGELWIIAGPNGAGKSTLVGAAGFRRLLDGVRFFNPDEITLSLLRAQGFPTFASAPTDMLRDTNIQAANEVYAAVIKAVIEGERVGVETVLSTGKYRQVVQVAQSLHRRIYLIYVSLVSPALARERVRRRVGLAGHDVPAEKVEERWCRSLDQLSWFASRADGFWLFDNSDSNRTAPLLLALGSRGADGAMEVMLNTSFRSPATDKLREGGAELRVTRL